MAEDKGPDAEPTLVERWLEDQQQWQRTLFTYLDSMMKNDEFLTHMGNAMRGSLLAGKPYPTAATQPPAPTEAADTADRLDKVLFALHQLQGQMQDVLMAIDEMRGVHTPAAKAAGESRQAARPRRPPAGRARTTRKRRTRS